MKQRSKAILIIFIFCGSFVFADNAQMHFSKITSDNGLSDNIARVILQDHQGFIWVGTQNGLNRFDGVDFKVYKNSPESPGTFSNNLITCAEISYDSILWVGTNHSIDYYIRETDSFEKIELCRIIKCEKRSKHFFVAAMHTTINSFYALVSSKDSLYLLKRDAETFDFNLLLSVPLKNKITYYAGGLTVDDKDNIWFGTHASGLYRLEQNGTLRHFEKNASSSESINSDFIHDIAVDHDGQVWIASYGGGISRYCSETETFKNYFRPNNTNKFLSDVNCIHIDHNNEIWIGIDKFGIAKYDRKTDKFIVFDEGQKSTNLSYYSVWSIFIDNNNGVWVGTYNGGINYWNKKNNRFSHIAPRQNSDNWLSAGMVNFFAELNDGHVLVSSDGGGIYCFDPNKMDFEEVKWDVNRIDKNHIKPIHIDKNNNLWAKLQNKKLYRLAYNNKTFQTIDSFLLDGKTISHKEVKTITSDASNNVWIGTDAGLNKYAHESGIIEHFPAIKEKHSLNSDYIRNIFVDDDNNLWLSTINGINYFNVKENCFYSSRSNPNEYNIFQNMGINAVFKDSKNRYWVATAWNGLFMFDSNNYDLIPVNPIPDFAYANICSILEDDHGNLWISTKTGLFKYNHDTGYFKPFTNNDGLQSNVFNENSSLKLRDGRFLFGGINGFNIFHPDSIADADTPSPIVITGLNLFNKPLAYPDSQLILNKQISESDTLNLKFKHSVFTIVFRMLNFSKPKNIEYAYKLEPFDTEWNYVNRINFANYTKLDPGTYTFSVKATTDNVNWHEREKKLIVIVSPPFYKTTWFRTTVFLITILITYFTYLLRTKQIRAINNKLNRKVKERTKQLEETALLLEERQEEISLQNEELALHRNKLEKLVQKRTHSLQTALKKAKHADFLKTAFLANLSHEIRTPMNSIIGFSNLLLHADNDDERQSFVQVINNNCDSLLVLINDIMDISMIEANQIRISKERVDIVAVMKELEETFRTKIPATINLELKHKPESCFIITDEVRLRQILSNLITNASKYTERGKIRFGFVVKTKEILFYVSDSGIGINRNEGKAVFKHFYKIDNHPDKLYRGVGIGLSICKKLVELLGGKIWYHSVINKGSTFFFTLPLNESCYTNKPQY